MQHFAKDLNMNERHNNNLCLVPLGLENIQNIVAVIALLGIIS